MNKIKEQVDQCYLDIHTAEDKLEKLRKECKHEETYIGNYSWRPGRIDKVTMCKFCGEVINNPYLINIENS